MVKDVTFAFWPKLALSLFLQISMYPEYLLSVTILSNSDVAIQNVYISLITKLNHEWSFRYTYKTLTLESLLTTTLQMYCWSMYTFECKCLFLRNDLKWDWRHEKIQLNLIRFLTKKLFFSKFLTGCEISYDNYFMLKRQKFRHQIFDEWQYNVKSFKMHHERTFCLKGLPLHYWMYYS